MFPRPLLWYCYLSYTATCQFFILINHGNDLSGPHGGPVGPIYGVGLLAKLTKVDVVVGVDHVPGAEHSGDDDSLELTDPGSKGNLNFFLSVKNVTRRLASEMAKVEFTVYTDAIFSHINNGWGFRH